MQRKREMVFVYGSLKRGFRNHHVMNQSAGRCAGTAVLTGYGLHSVYSGAFPGIVRRDNRYKVHGELFSIPAERLPRMDAFEGVPSLYTRERVRVRSGKRKFWAWVYVFARTAELGKRVPGGRWKERR